MSILIKGMEMPSKCYECFLQNECDLVNPYYVESTRPQDCPLVEVPSAEHHKLNIAEYIHDRYPDVWNQAEKELEVPSAERTGKWISDWGGEIKMIDGCPDGSCHCSYCGEWLVASDEYAVKGIYCPNCGARMEGVKDDSR